MQTLSATRRNNRAGRSWRRGDLMECLREQPNPRRDLPDRVVAAANVAAGHSVERRCDPGARTCTSFVRTPRAQPHTPSARRNAASGSRTQHHGIGRIPPFTPLDLATGVAPPEHPARAED